jgi:hypothetical protein
MKLLSVLLPALTLLTTTFALPSASVSPRYLAQRGLCSGQGVGSCNFGITYYHDIVTGAYNKDVQLFNYKCQQIGYYYNVVTGTIIDSQLPYTVIMNNVAGTTSGPIFSFSYAGQTLTNTNCYCSDCSTAVVTMDCCQCGFNC